MSDQLGENKSNLDEANLLSALLNLQKENEALKSRNAILERRPSDQGENDEDVTDSLQRERDELSLNDSKQDFDFKKKAFLGAVFGAGVLAIGAFSFAMLGLLAVYKWGSPVWFVLLLPVTFITPATILYIAILRGLYKEPAKEKKEGAASAIPQIKVLQELIKALASDNKGL